MEWNQNIFYNHKKTSSHDSLSVCTSETLHGQNPGMPLALGSHNYHTAIIIAHIISHIIIDNFVRETIKLKPICPFQNR